MINQKMKHYLIILLFSSFYSFSQEFEVTVKNIKEGDSVRIIVQKGSENRIDSIVHFNSNGDSKVSFNLSEGYWSLITDATGYTFPTAYNFNFPDVSSATVKLTPLLNEDYVYTWQDDDSYAGHATQSYIVEPSKLVVIDDTVRVPSNYSSIKLRNNFGIILSDDSVSWSSEDSYKLFKSFSRTPSEIFGEGNNVDFESGENVKAIFYLTNKEQHRDLLIETLSSGIKKVTISKSAFIYASPLVGNLDGIRVRFYSKRLYNAVVNYITDFGKDEEKVNRFATEKFGFRFMVPGDEVEAIMGEDASNFQEFFADEKVEVLSMMEELPEGMQKQPELKYLIRRINGQVNPDRPAAAAIAWGGRNTIEYMSSAFQSQISNIRRIILHEKAHFVSFYSLDAQTKADWAELGGWFEDPGQPSGWSTYNTTEFVSSYGHDMNPEEDFAECFSNYVENVEILKERSMRKYEFIRDRIMHGTTYKAQIREDLTFTVYNLFPDHTYPGKIVKSKIEISGEADEDKTVKVEFKLHTPNFPSDGASVGYIRLASTAGTIHDLWLYPKNGDIDSILVGTTTFSKHEKNGYWTPTSLRIEDPAGNSRYENTSTIGFKFYMENPLEDITPPVYNYDIDFDTVTIMFDPKNNYKGGVRGNIGKGDAVPTKALKVKYSFYDDIPLHRSITRFHFPKLDNPDAQLYELQIQDGVVIDSLRGYDNGYQSDKHFEMYLPIFDFFPSGYYAFSMTNTGDYANNYTNLFFVKDTADFVDNPKKGRMKTVRDSIYIKTPYPDYIPPEIDPNKITIQATPTNPEAPDGETRVDISLFVRDLSDFEGYESGVKFIYYTLRDPNGKEYTFSSWNDNKLFDIYTGVPANNNDWQIINLDIVLPKGSAPGKWGLSSVRTRDLAGNSRDYSFIEYVRFDVIESDIVLTSPLYAEITDKLVNASNVDSITAFISCVPCSDLKYNYTIYSLMGGVVKTGEKLMGSDSVYVTDLDVSGIPDGVIKLTVQLKDTLDQLIATTTTDYTKDVILPSAYYLQKNLQDLGTSNLDSLVIDVMTDEINGEYVLTVIGDSIVGGNSILSKEEIDINLFSSNQESVRAKRVITGKVNDITQSIPITNLSNFADGLIKFELVVTDSALNVGSEIFKDSIYKQTNSVPITLDQSVSTDEDTSIIIFLTGTDEDGDSLTFTVGNASNGTVTQYGDTVLYTPNPNYNGSDSFVYTVSDGISSSSSTITITVESMNDIPVTNDLVVTVSEDTSNYEIILSATDAENNTLTYSIVDPPSFGNLDTTTLGDSRVRAYESRNAGQHQHNSHYSGSPKTTIEGQANAVVSHLVNGHPSAIWRDIYSITADDPWVSTYSRGTDGELRPSLLSTVGPGLGSGFKGGHLFVPEVMFETFKAAFNETAQAILEDTANYVMFGDPGGKVLYTPNENFFGTDSFTYVATDSNGGVSSKATVSITVTPTNDEPTSADVTLNLSEDSNGFIILPGSDADGDTLTFTVGAASNGTVTQYGDTVLYTPNPNYNGMDSLEYTVSDGISTSTSTITITITSVYDLPEITFSLVDTISIEENESMIPISIKLEGIDAGDESVTFDLMLSGTASNSDDYIVNTLIGTSSSTFVSIPPGEVEASGLIAILDDAEYEEEETIVIGVENVSNALDTVQSVTITILRNDVPLGENSHRIISRVYPNPAKDYFTIEFSEIFELEEIDMVDPLGRVYAPSIIEINKKQLKIDSSILSGGTHILRLKTDKGSASFRIIVE